MSEIVGAPQGLATEAILVIDLVESTEASDIYGWYAVGRGLIRELREDVRRIFAGSYLRCIKSTGDGLLLGLRDDEDAMNAAKLAVDLAETLIEEVATKNAAQPVQQRRNLRVAVHFGEVDIVEADREGPAVAFAFRMDSVRRSSLPAALQGCDPSQFPEANYILLSEHVDSVLRQRTQRQPLSTGFHRLRGFHGRHELFLINPLASAEPSGRRLILD